MTDRAIVSAIACMHARRSCNVPHRPTCNRQRCMRRRKRHNDRFTSLGYSPAHAPPRILLTTYSPRSWPSAVPSPPAPVATLERASRIADAVAAASQPSADPQLPRVRAAIEAAERGGFDAAQYADLARHPLYGWIEYASLRRNIDTLSNCAGAGVPVALRRPGRSPRRSARSGCRDRAPQGLAGAAAPRGSPRSARTPHCAAPNCRRARPQGRADAQWDRRRAGDVAQHRQAAARRLRCSR